MPAIVFQNKFPRDCLNSHLFGTHAFKFGLSNVAIAATVEDTTGITPISTGNGWAGPFDTAATGSDGTGTAAVAFADSATITALGGSIGPFRYGYLYNDSTTPKRVIGVVDYGTNITITVGNSVVVDFSGNAITLNNV